MSHSLRTWGCSLADKMQDEGRVLTGSASTQEALFDHGPRATRPAHLPAWRATPYVLVIQNEPIPKGHAALVLLRRVGTQK